MSNYGEKEETIKSADKLLKSMVKVDELPQIKPGNQHLEENYFICANINTEKRFL